MLHMYIYIYVYIGMYMYINDSDLSYERKNKKKNENRSEHLIFHSKTPKLDIDYKFKSVFNFYLIRHVKL
jgi:hypothetical protein